MLFRSQTPPRQYQESEVYDVDRPRGRVKRTPSPLSDRTRVADTFGPSDSVPQRRAREYDPEYDQDLKRRRIDDNSYRRRLSPDRHASLSPMADVPPSQVLALTHHGAYSAHGFLSLCA